jgi:hypothetical protein
MQAKRKAARRRLLTFELVYQYWLRLAAIRHEANASTIFISMSKKCTLLFRSFDRNKPMIGDGCTSGHDGRRCCFKAPKNAMGEAWSVVT